MTGGAAKGHCMSQPFLLRLGQFGMDETAFQQCNLNQASLLVTWPAWRILCRLKLSRSYFGCSFSCQILTLAAGCPSQRRAAQALNGTLKPFKQVYKPAKTALSLGVDWLQILVTGKTIQCLRVKQLFFHLPFSCLLYYACTSIAPL